MSAVHLVPLDHLPGDRVVVDLDINGIVVQVSLRPRAEPTYQVEWWSGGALVSHWFDASRLRAVK